LKTLPPPTESLPAQMFGQNFVTHERMLWPLSDLPWDRIERHRLDEPTLAAVHAAMLIESHNPVYAAHLFTRFRSDFTMTSFLSIWTYEEFKHFAGLKAYLELAEGTAIGQVEEELIKTRAGEWFLPDHYTDLMLTTYTMVQELATGIFYKSFAQRVEEPVLRTLLAQIGKDEYRHCQFYFDCAKRLLDADRSRLDEVDEALLDFQMPGPSFVPDFERHSAALEAAANPGLVAFREAIGKVSKLVGKAHMLRLASQGSYRRRLQENWGIESRQLLGFF
jgi:acyl-[acyl-carrier-protein] desaturase